MKTLMMMLLFCHVSPAVKHSLKMYLTLSSGVSNIPEFVIIAKLENVGIAYYDGDIKTIEPRQDWIMKLILADPQSWKGHAQGCVQYQQIFREETDSFKRHSNQTGGVQIIQEILGCEWDNETGRVDSYKQYGYNGEDFLTFDAETATWIAAKPQAESTKREWDGKKESNAMWKDFVTNTCPAWLKKFLKDGESVLQRTEIPSVSLLQKTLSSPVSCHTTGFYPDRAVLFWRKDGEEIHEDVDHGEILPNHDGTFQMSADLDLSSVTPEDWRRYDCVFQLSGVKDDIITRLDKAVIRTNWESKFSNITIPITAAVLVVAVILIAAVGFTVYKKKKKANRPPPPAINGSELSEKLNPET